MQTLKKIKVNHCFVDTIPDALEKDMIYISKKYKTCVHLCLCGCGNQSVTPVGINNWSILEDKKGITFNPSILNNNCPNKYHYIITKGVANVV